MTSDFTTPCRRFYCPHLSLDEAALEGDQARHATRVLRLRAGETVELFDGCGTVARGTIQHVGRDQVTVSVDQRRREEAAAWEVTIASAVPKGNRLQDMISQLVQVGVDRWIPLRCERASVNPREAKLERLERVVVESARQCRRAWLMRIEAMRSLAQILGESADVRLVAHPGGPRRPRLGEGSGRAVVLIGPEGGWTDAELEQAREAGWNDWSLGPHVMRLETAAVVAAALLR